MNNKTQILTGINAWIDNKIDQLSADSVWMALASNTIKRMASEAVEMFVPMDILEMALANHGVVDATILADEFIASLQIMDEVSTEIGGGAVLHLSNGAVKLELPSNAVIKAMLSGDNVIVFNADDIRELAEYINNAKN